MSATIETTLYPPTPQECADFEAFHILLDLLVEMDNRRMDRITSADAVDAFNSYEIGGPDIPDVMALAAAVRPSGVRPRTMRFEHRGGTRKGYSREEVWDGAERIFRRYCHESSGVHMRQPDGWATLNDEFCARCPLYSAWEQFCMNPDGEIDYSDPFPTTAEEFRAKRFGPLFLDVDKRRPPLNEKEERQVRRELAFLSRSRT